jgi:G patch domain-containing protein 1
MQHDEENDISDPLEATVDQEVPSPSVHRSPPPQYPFSASAASGSSNSSPRPPVFASLFEPSSVSGPNLATQELAGPAAPAYVPVAAALGLTLESRPAAPTASQVFQDETKRALPRDIKGGEPSSRSKNDEAEPPPAYSEGDSPLPTFAFVMAAAGGAASLITQVQQGAPPINTLGGAFTRSVHNKFDMIGA